MDRIVFEGDLMEMRLVEIYLKENNIRCRTIEVTPGYRVYSKSQIIVDENQFKKANTLVCKYLKETTEPFKLNVTNAISFGLIALLILFFILQSIFHF